MVGIGRSEAADRSLSEISPPASAMVSSSSKTRSTDWTELERPSATWVMAILSSAPFVLRIGRDSTIQKAFSVLGYLWPACVWVDLRQIPR